MPTGADQEAERHAAAKEDARQRDILASIQTGQLADTKALLATAQRSIERLEREATVVQAEAPAAKERLAKIEGGEDPGTVPRPMTRGEVLKAVGWTEADARHAGRLIQIDQLGGWNLLMQEVQRQHRRAERTAARTILARLQP